MLPDLGDTETSKKKNRERGRDCIFPLFTELIEYGEGCGKLEGIVFSCCWYKKLPQN